MINDALYDISSPRPTQPRACNFLGVAAQYQRPSSFFESLTLISGVGPLVFFLPLAFALQKLIPICSVWAHVVSASIVLSVRIHLPRFL